MTVQWVRTSWTKRSRGGPAAARRNAAAAGFAVPSQPSTLSAPSPSMPSVHPAHLAHLVHLVRMGEADGFAPREGWEVLPPGALGLREADGRLRVLPPVEPLYGLPPRARRPPAVRLAPGQWVRWQLNYRFSSAAGVRDWSYWLDTFNIAYGPAGPGLFLTEPTVLVDECGPVR
ncbi:hypothetical protein [Streptomyces sp. CB01881]|uniref:hypothetical protein n=1 Tax=Streptomyces sp. CB01881 TaxID=2078691 RepID=UPI000CDBF59E|nr:hypothetical protein [Streptomyces sp. CB01881]AUY53869.1 hypothetical protein C2142_01155 [Streptomyces sp. CB01881]TYC77740.1 hypothetical protein EH183_01150 [Streptomyces sp. CB01881]